MKFDLLKFLEKYGFKKLLFCIFVAVSIMMILPEETIIYIASKFTKNPQLQAPIVTIGIAIIIFIFIELIKKIKPLVIKKKISIELRKEILKSNPEVLCVFYKFYNYTYKEFSVNSIEFYETDIIIDMRNRGAIKYSNSYLFVGQTKFFYSLNENYCCALNMLLKKGNIKIVNKKLVIYVKK